MASALSTRTLSWITAAGLCGSAAAQLPATLGSALRQQPAAASLARMQLAHGDLADFSIAETADSGIVVTLDAANGPRTIALSPHSLRASTFQLLVDRNGVLEPTAAPPATTYRGIVLDDPSSQVAASVIDGGLWLAVYPSADSAWFAQPAQEIGGASNQVVVYRQDDLLPGDWRCGTDDALATQSDDADGETPINSRGAACLKRALIAFDADFEFFAQNGSSIPATVADIELVMNSVDLIYARDAGITYELGTIIVRSTDPDPYSQSGTGDILGEFRNYWAANHTDVPRDIAHLMTGRPVANGVIGVAWLSVICNAPDGIGYGFSRSRFTTNLASRTGLTSHEIGHNWSAAHCDGDTDCYIMCSGIGGCSSDTTRFGTRSMSSIASFRDSRTCLDDAPPYATAIPPRARNDSGATILGQPIRIDVLANDVDGNCDPIAIGTFATTTIRGGTVALSVGSGPGGRNELLYTPPASTTATSDTFTYAATDGALNSANATVTVALLTLRNPDSPWSLRSGLRTRYYALEDQFVPDFTGRTPSTTDTMPTINIASTTDVFATSGRADYVGAVFTGTLNIATAGDYRFYTESDDGSILYVDDRVVVANDGFHGMLERSGLINLSAGAHNVRVEFWEGGGGAGLIARIEGPGLTKQVIPAELWQAPGVAVQYYALSSVPTALPSFTTLAAYHEDVTANVNLPASQNYILGSGRRYGVAVQFSGYFLAQQTGIYTFSVESDDGSKLFIGTPLLVNNDGSHGMTDKSAPIALLPGYHELRLTWYQGGSDSGLILRVEGPGLPRQVIPAALLFSEQPADCDRNGVNDTTQTTEALDVGDIITGGDGRGSGLDGRGVRPRLGTAVNPANFGESGTNAAAVFNATNGVAGRVNLPLVDGVFLPRDTTQVASTGLTFRFSPTSGNYYDAIRGDVAFQGTGLATIDSPAAGRGGVGMHANGGFTIDLNKVRVANPGRLVERFEAVPGVNLSAIGADCTFELWVLVDGQIRYRDLFAGYGKLFERISIPLAAGDRFLTLAVTDAGVNSSDHAVFADAKLLITSPADPDGNGLPAPCDCVGDLNTDGERNLTDLATMLRYFGLTAGAGRQQGDTDSDGDVDLTDLAQLLANFGLPCP